MSCIASEHEIKAHLPKLDRTYSEIIVGSDKIIKLERGGYIIKTKIGNIQFGMPPETVKDSINLGLTVPTYYLLPSNRFDKKFGINVAEFEFPAYFNFFVLRKRIVLVCDQAAKKSIELIFQETLLGPKEFPYEKDEFHPAMDPSRRPNFQSELKYFAKNPFKPTEEMRTDHLIDFILYDNKNRAYLDQDVYIEKESNKFNFYEGNELIASLKDRIKVRDKRYDDFMNDQQNQVINMYKSLQNPLDNLSYKLQPNLQHFFNAPKFGVTVLGASHGFDPKGSTSGYVIWINGRGIMVDPPPFSSYILKKNGVPHSIIDKIIITHCHADHDAGSFQKVLFASQIEVMTTPTIMGSFIRKYSALTNIPAEELKKLFIFRPVVIGHHINVLGAQLRFFYSFHSIPCIGFEAFYGDKSLYFSGDTFYNPTKLQELYQNGVLSRGRLEALTDIEWSKYDIILHEAGVPPIHTPMTVLQSFPNEVKEKLYLVHVAEKDVPKDSNLKIAKPGLENTIRLEVESAREEEVYDKLDLIASIDLFNELPVKKARDLMRCSFEEHYLPGQFIIKEGTLGDKFYIIANGIVKIFNSSFEKFGFVGDYFGEAALSTNSKRNANVQAVTNLTVLVIEKMDFLYIFGIYSGESKIISKFANLAFVRKGPMGEVMSKNAHLSQVNESQRTMLQMVMKEKKFKANDTIWKKNDDPTICIFIISGQVKYTEGPQDIINYTLFEGACAGEFQSLIRGEKLTTTLIATEDTEAYKIDRVDLIAVLNRTPGLLVYFHDNYFIEQKHILLY